MTEKPLLSERSKVNLEAYGVAELGGGGHLLLLTLGAMSGYEPSWRKDEQLCGLHANCLAGDSNPGLQSRSQKR